MSPRGEELRTSVTWRRHRPLCRPLPCPLLSSPSLWSLPTRQDPLLCPRPHARLPLLRRQPLRCRTPRSLHLTAHSPLWPPTPADLHSRSRSASPTAINCRSLHSSRRCSATQVLSSRRPISRRCFPRQALRCRTVPSAAGVLLMTAATKTTKKGPEGKNLKKKPNLNHIGIY